MNRIINLFAYFLLITSVSLANTTTNIPFAKDTIPITFKETVPNLKLLESGFPFVNKSFEAEYTTFEKDYFGPSNNKIAYKITAIDLTTEKIKDLVGSSYFEWEKDSTKARDNNPPTIHKLEIFCKKLTMNHSIWIPEAEIIIHADSLIMNGKSIVSNPMKWNACMDAVNIVKGQRRDGNDGINAGNITVKAIDIIGKGRIIAKGTDGEHIYVPAKLENIKSPSSERRSGFVAYQGTNETKKSAAEAKKNPDMVYNFDRNIVGAFGFYENTCYGWGGYYTGQISIDSDIEMNYSSKERSSHRSTDAWFKQDLTIKDIHENRLPIKGNFFKPGKGGNGGEIKLFSNANQIELVTNGGKTGVYLDPNKTYEKSNPKGISDYKWKQEQYFGYAFSMHSSCGLKNWNEHKRNWYIPGFEVPSDKEISELGYNFKKPNDGGSKGKTYLMKLSEPNITWTAIPMKYFEEQFSVFYKKDKETKSNLLKKVEAFKAKLKSKVDSGLYSSIQESTLRTYISKLTGYASFPQRNLDVYDNGPGYRPMLAMQQMMNYFENNMETDMRIYVEADMIAEREERIGDLKQSVKMQIPFIQDRISTLNTKRKNVGETLNKLSIEAIRIKDSLENLTTELGKLETALREKHIKKKAWNDATKVSLKFCAVTISVIPIGQPVLSQTVGNSLNSISDAIGNDDANIVTSALGSIDLSGTMEELSKRKIKGLKLGGLQNPLERREIAIEAYEKNGLQSKANQLKAQKFFEENARIINMDLEQEKINKIKKDYSKYGEQGEKILKSFGNYALTQKNIEGEINKIMTSSYEFVEIGNKIKRQKRKEQKMFSKLMDSMQKMQAYDSQINEYVDQLFALKMLEIDPNNYNAELSSRIRSVSENAKERLKRMEYELVKIYEYTTLDKFNVGMPSHQVLDVLYERLKNDQEQPIDTIVNKLLLEYKAKVQEIKNSIITKAKSSSKQDAKSDAKGEVKYGRCFSLDEDFQPFYINSLNNNYEVDIDLQRDLLTEVIQPDQANIRIMDIELDEILFDGEFPKGTRMKIKTELDDGGILRSSKNDFYYFDVYDETEEALASWEWEVNGNNKINNKSTASDQIKQLVRFIASDGKSNSLNQDEEVFAYPPAWTNMKIKLVPLGRAGALPKIKRLTFSIRCSYTSMSNNKRKILDVRMRNNPKSAQLYLEVNQDTTTHIPLNYYQVHADDSRVSVSVNMAKDVDGNKITNGKKFSHWEPVGAPGTFFKENELKKETITFDLKYDLRLTAIFVDEKSTDQNSLSTPQVIYTAPSDTSEILGNAMDKSEYRIADDNIDDGYQRVFFGMVEGYIKE